MEDINRIKVVLVEKKRINKWLAEQLGVNPSTVLNKYQLYLPKREELQAQLDALLSNEE